MGVLGAKIRLKYAIFKKNDIKGLCYLKTEFVKTDPIRINYRDYKKFNASIFQQNLEMKLSSDKNSHVDYSIFQNIFCEVLNHHAP